MNDDENEQRSRECAEVANDILISMHLMMSVMYGFLHDRVNENKTALCSMEVLEGLHAKLFELSQELGGYFGEGCVIPQYMS